MRLRRSSEGSTSTSEATPSTAWDGIPSRPAGEPLIKAPRAAEVVAPPQAA